MEVSSCFFGANLYTWKSNVLEHLDWKDINKLNSKNLNLVNKFRFETLNWSYFGE